MSQQHDDIGQALEAWVSSLPFEGKPGEGPGILGDWIAVVAMVDVGPDGSPRAEYYVALRDGSMLGHVAKGLLRQGMDELADMMDHGNSDS